MILADADRKCTQLGECDVASERRHRARPRDIGLPRAVVMQLPSRGRLTEGSRTGPPSRTSSSTPHAVDSGACRHRGEVLMAATFATRPIQSLLILLRYYSAINMAYCSDNRSNRRRVGSSQLGVSSFTVASTHSWISSFTARASRPAATTGAPMTTRTVPGFFISPRRGQ